MKQLFSLSIYSIAAKTFKNKKKNDTIYTILYNNILLV